MASFPDFDTFMKEVRRDLEETRRIISPMREIGNINPDRVIFSKRTALLNQYPTCCACNKTFPDSIQNYWYVQIIRNGVSLPSEPCYEECVARFLGIPVEEVSR